MCEHNDLDRDCARCQGQRLADVIAAVQNQMPTATEAFERLAEAGRRGAAAGRRLQATMSRMTEPDQDQVAETEPNESEVE